MTRRFSVVAVSFKKKVTNGAALAVGTPAVAQSRMPAAGEWSAPEAIGLIGGALAGVSCVGKSWCMVVGDHDWMTYDGTSWSVPSTQHSRSTWSADVACVSKRFCMSDG